MSRARDDEASKQGGKEPGAERPAEAAAQESAGAESVEASAGELAAKVEDLKDRYQRAMAEYLNYQKRSIKEREAARLFGMRDLLRGLLPSFDNLSRALRLEESADPAAWRDGVRLVEAEIQRVLGEFGISVVDPKGSPFDPRYHEAIARAQSGGVADGTVLEVAERGYTMGEIIIRPARVVVAARPAGDPPEHGASKE